MIKQVIKSIKQIFILQSKFEEDKVKCSIDEQKVNCFDLEAPIFEYGPGHFTQRYGWFGGRKEPENNTYVSYIGIPAPAYLKDDEWFGPAPIKSQKQVDYMVQELEIKRQEREQNFSIESEDIHQKMYEIATKNHNTTIQLNPLGGSENFQEGPGGWNSGTGWGRVQK
jgi:hypothetical protein